MNYITFKSDVSIVGGFKHNYSDEIVKNEPMLFRSSFDFAYENGGEITKSFLEGLPDWVKDKPISFDSRVHMLMPTWIPAIAGWHHDDVPRSLPSGQPNYENPEYNSKHILGIVNAHISPTEFAIGEVNYPIFNDKVYKEYDNLVNKDVESGVLKVVKSESGFYYYFDSHSFHRATVCNQRGWRWFGRVSFDNQSALSPKNEIRRQVQVYLTNVNEGW